MSIATLLFSPRFELQTIPLTDFGQVPTEVTINGLIARARTNGRDTNFEDIWSPQERAL